MKKLFALLLAAILLLAALSACGSSSNEESSPSAANEDETVSQTSNEEDVDVSPSGTRTQFPITLPMYFCLGVQVEQTYTEVPERVFVYGQDMIDFMVYFGLEDRIVGICTRGADVVADSHLPEEYHETIASLPVLSEDYWPSMEVVIAAQPDLIATAVGGLFNNDEFPEVTDYNKIGINIYEITNNASGKSVVTMDDYFDSITAFGQIFDIQDEVNAYVDAQKEAIQSYANLSASDDAPTVLTIFYSESGWGIFPTSAMATAITTYMGAVSFAEEGVYDISAEGIIEKDPDVVLISDTSDAGMTLEDFLALPEISVLRAAQEGHVYVLSGNEVEFFYLYNGCFDMSGMVDTLGKYIFDAE